MRVVEAPGGARRLGRRPRRPGVVDDGEAPRLGDRAPDDPAHRRAKAEPPEPAVLDPPVKGLPAQPWRQRQQGLRDVPAARQQGADDQFREGGLCRLRDGPHDLLNPCRKRRREAGLAWRFHVVFGRLGRLRAFGCDTRNMGLAARRRFPEPIRRLSPSPD